MKNFKLDTIIKTFEKTKTLAYGEFEKERLNNSLNYISIAAEIAYKFNWIYTDQQLENLLVKISEKTLKKPVFESLKNKVVFYDSFCWENRGLTQQYLRAFFNYGFEILYIYEGEEQNTENKIIKELKEYSFATIIRISNTINLEELVQIQNEIIKFQPEKVFMHVYPSSPAPVVLFNSFPKIPKFQINLTDHAFWLGTSCTNYSIEFRNYGFNVSTKKRGLEANQCLIQPYYPITDCKEFKGFPLNVDTNNTIIFSGGSEYKMYGEGNAYFKILDGLLKIKPTTQILIALSGESEHFTKFIKENNYEDKIILIGNRPDIGYVFENCDIYLSTFPLAGGLMGQLAAAYKKPILAYSSENLPLNFIEGLLNGNVQKNSITNLDLNSFFNEASKLLTDENYRISNGQELFNKLTTIVEFNNNLKNLLDSNKSVFHSEDIQIDFEKVTNLYLDVENNYTKSFGLFVIIKFKIKALYLFPNIIFRTLLKKQTVRIIFLKLIGKSY